MNIQNTIIMLEHLWEEKYFNMDNKRELRHYIDDIQREFFEDKLEEMKLSNEEREAIMEYLGY